MRYRYISLQVGHNVQLPDGWRFVRLRTKVQKYYKNLFKKLLPALSVANSVARTRRDMQLYDESLWYTRLSDLLV